MKEEPGLLETSRPFDALLARIDGALEALRDARHRIADCREVVAFHTSRDSASKRRKTQSEACHGLLANEMGETNGPPWLVSRLEAEEDECSGTVETVERVEWDVLMDAWRAGTILVRLEVNENKCRAAVQHLEREEWLNIRKAKIILGFGGRL